MISSSETWKEFFETYYQREINRLAGIISEREKGSKGLALHVNFFDIAIFREGKLAEELLDQPDVVLEHAREGLRLVHTIYDDVPTIDVPIRVYNLPSFRKILIRDLRWEHVGKLIAIEGIVRRVTEVRPKLMVATFLCEKCGKKIEVEQPYDHKIVRPYKCPACNNKRRFKLIPNEGIGIDNQRIQIQDYPENLRGGEQPQFIDIFLKDDLVGKVKAGDRIIVNGILRCRERGNKPFLDFYLEAVSIEILEQEYEEIVITQDDVKKIKELASNPNIYDILVRSIAPSIYGHETIKLALILQLFGGVPKILPDGLRIRGDIHILLVGDPSVAKSQLLRAIKNVAPRCVYTSGKGVSVAGLTCAVVRDEFDGRWTLEAGALVLADKGIAIIDEFDKMKKENRSALNEALEQQVVSVSKAGITATLKARCSLLASANPKYGRFNRYEPIVEQIDLDPTLLSRFDLIFIMLDEPDEKRDSLISEHILNIHELGERLQIESSNTCDWIKPLVDPTLLKKYVAYARKNIIPVLTPEAKEKIKEFYISLRSLANKDEHNAVAITTRQLEAIIRLAEASAKVRLSDKVEQEDVERAIEIFRASLEEIAVDPETGTFDIDYAFTGTSATMRDRILIIKEIIRELENTTKYGAPEDEIVRLANEKGIDRERVSSILDKLKTNGEVFCPRYGYYRLVKY